MKKTVLTGLILLFGGLTLVAQSGQYSHEGHFYAGIQQGPMLNIYENYFSYVENKKPLDLITFQAALVGGYDVNEMFGVRLTAGYAKNAAACNTHNTSAHGFYPYTFSSINVFADAILDLQGMSDRLTAFRIKLYGGLGLGHSFNMTDSQHPWQAVQDPSTAFGFRLGGIAEYNIFENFAMYLDVCGEAYSDEYNGLLPSLKDQTDVYEGYGGFPFDLRGLISIGFIYRFGQF
ncbi:MAG: outer membrane beta-barrel protein [Bacteroidales bacterium]|nr:outer membrane beta-barrel protein [Bacteroidales bacterium]